MVEKIEVSKNTGNYFYTGELSYLKDEEGWVLIKTTHNETYKFRIEQIQQRRILDKI